MKTENIVVQASALHLSAMAQVAKVSHKSIEKTAQHLLAWAIEHHLKPCTGAVLPLRRRAVDNLLDYQGRRSYDILKECRQNVDKWAVQAAKEGIA